MFVLYSQGLNVNIVSSVFLVIYICSNI